MTGVKLAESFPVGTWLSLVEHSLGVRGVGSSNLPVPTNQSFTGEILEFAGQLTPCLGGSLATTQIPAVYS